MGANNRPRGTAVIHHVSIPAKDPKHVAKVLAEVMQGRAYPFPGNIPDSFMAVSGDPHGTMIEVYPEAMTLVPGEGDDQVRTARQREVPPAWPFHLLLSVPICQTSIEGIGAREGWRTQLHGRGAPGQPPLFHVIEFWIENRLMIELVTEQMTAPYTDLVQIWKLDAMLGRTGAPA